MLDRSFLTLPALVSLASLLGIGAFASGCGDDGADGSGGGSSSAEQSSSSTGGVCAGFVDANGQCVGACTPDQCLEGNTCVGNQCALICDEVADCYPGSTCADGTEDGTGAAVKTCKPTGKAAILGATCYFGNECAAWSVCPDGTACGASVCGGQACTEGLCPDGSACAPQTCDATACRAPRCFGSVDATGQSPSGEAYCTQDDCTVDTDCAAGMYCGKTRDFHEACGKDYSYSDEQPCIDPSEYTTAGKTFEDGPVTLLRNTCVLRTQCSPCATDTDCTGVAGQLCAQFGGESRCAATCASDADCERDAACLADAAHGGQLVCTPRYGSCAGQGEFCSPCVTDLDCGPPGTAMVCDANSLLGGDPLPSRHFAQGCFDLTFPDDCTSDTTCPLSVDGVHHGQCLDSGEGYTPSDGVYQRCFLPFNTTSYRYQCW